MIDFLVAITVSLLLIIAGVLTLTGSVGLLQMTTFFKRIHAPTLANTLGVFCVLVATILLATVHEHHLVVHPILITLFLFITSPVTAMLLMRAAIQRQAEEKDDGDRKTPSLSPEVQAAEIHTGSKSED